MDMVLDGCHRDEQRLGQLPIRVAGRDQCCHFAFAMRQLGKRRMTPRPGIDDGRFTGEIDGDVVRLRLLQLDEFGRRQLMWLLGNRRYEVANLGTGSVVHAQKIMRRREDLCRVIEI